MDKSSDSSDSDSNSSTSWVFVDDTATLTQSAANTFHLDCSREPIQELTEQDLLSGGSDLESDTDGVSVISESEVPTDDSYSNIPSISISSNETPETKEEITLINNKEPTIINNDNIEELHSESLMTVEEPEKPNITELTKNVKPLHLLGIGFVLIAVCVASYNQIMTKMSEKDFKEDDLALYDKIDLPSNNDLDKLCDNKRKWEKEIVQEELNNDKHLYKVKMDSNKKILNKRALDKHEDENLERIIDITVACAFRENPTSNLVNKAIKECASKEYQRQKDEENRGESLWSPKKKKAKYVYKYKDEKLTDNEYQMHTTEEILQAQSQQFIQTNAEKRDYNKISKGKESVEYKHKNKHYKRKNDKIKYNDNDEPIVDFKTNEDINKTRKKSEKHNQLKKSNKYESEENISVKQTHKKDLNYEKSYKKLDKLKYDDDYYNVKKLSKKSHKYKTDKKDKKNDKSYEKKIRKPTSKSDNFDGKHKKYRYDTNFINNNSGKFEEMKNKLNGNYLKQRKQNNSDGEWYINLHKGRDNIRKQEHVSDWVFDRAHMRSQKRNKAQWYFKWMNVREQLRYKRSYKPYSS